MVRDNGMFPTRSNDLAQFLLYAMPDNSLARITKDEGRPGRYFFSFEDVSACRSLADEFYGSEPVAIGDLWAYNRAVRELRRNMRHAEQYGGWIKGESN